jgi:hypothetical protein
VDVRPRRDFPEIAIFPEQEKTQIQEIMAKQRTRYSDLLDAIRELDAAERASVIACDARGALPPGTSRARVTTANANWARKAEHRGRLQGRAEAEILRVFSHLAPETKRTLSFSGTNADCEPFSGEIQGVPDSLTALQTRWLIYGRLIDRNTVHPFGYDPNDCVIE